MARHEVVIHENTGALKTDAPYLGSYIAKETIRIEGFIAAVASLCGLPAIQVQAILTGSFDVIEELERESLVRVHTDIGTICGVITGSFPTADAAFDPERNRLNLVLRLDDEIRTTLANVVPTIATDEDLTKLRIDNVMDLAVPRPYNLIHGQHVFRVAGFNMVLTDEGAAAYLQNALGTTFDLVIDEVVTKQLFKAHCADEIEPGDYKLVVKSKAGDAGGPLQTAFRRVKLMKVESPKPKITVTDMSASKVDEFVSASFDGENFDAVQGYAEGEEGTSFPATFDVAGRRFEGQPVRWTGEQWATMFPCSDVSEGDELTMTLTPDPARTDIDQTPVVVKQTL